MAAFDYLALDIGGKKRKGIIEADNLRNARALLRERQLTPLDVFASREKSTFPKPLPWFKQGLSVADTALFTRQVATLLRAGIPLENALDAVARQSEKSSVKRVVMALRGKVREGQSLAAGLKEHGHTFSSLYRATVDAGERTGHLDTVLEKLADYTESQRQFRQRIQLALIYPVILVVMSLLIVTGLMMFVVPEILNVIIEADQALPLPTQILVSISDLLSQHGHWLVLALAVLAALGQWLMRQPAVRDAWHRKLLQLWGIKRFSRGTNAARYTSTLAILLQSGIPLSEAMPIASAVCSNTVFKQATRAAEAQVREGRSLHLSLEHSGFFPPMALQLIASGEHSGNLAEMLQRVATTQEDDLQQRVTTLVSLFEPLTLLMMGAMVLGIVLAVLLPILNFNQLVS